MIDRLANGRGKKADGMSRGKEKGEVEKKRGEDGRERKRHENGQETNKIKKAPRRLTLFPMYTG